MISDDEMNDVTDPENNLTDELKVLSNNAVKYIKNRDPKKTVENITKPKSICLNKKTTPGISNIMSLSTGIAQKTGRFVKGAKLDDKYYAVHPIVTYNGKEFYVPSLNSKLVNGALIQMSKAERAACPAFQNGQKARNCSEQNNKMVILPSSQVMSEIQKNVDNEPKDEFILPTIGIDSLFGTDEITRSNKEKGQQKANLPEKQLINIGYMFNYDDDVADRQVSDNVASAQILKKMLQEPRPQNCTEQNNKMLILSSSELMSEIQKNVDNELNDQFITPTIRVDSVFGTNEITKCNKEKERQKANLPKKLLSNIGINTFNYDVDDRDRQVSVNVAPTPILKKIVDWEAKIPMDVITFTVSIKIS